MAPTSLPRTTWPRSVPATHLGRGPRPGVTRPAVRPAQPPRPAAPAAAASTPVRPAGDAGEPSERAMAPGSNEAGTGTSGEATRTAHEFFRRYAAALDALDLPAVAAAHAEPTFVVTDDGGEVVNRRAEVVTFFRGVLGEYRDRALVSAHPEVEAVEVLTDRLVEAVVRWSYADADGRVAVVDRYRYLLRREGRHRLLIQTTLVLDPPRAAG